MYNVALIGIGNIGLLYDDNKGDKTKSLSHVKSIYRHEHFSLLYIIDTNDSNLDKVKSFFPNVQYFSQHTDIIYKDDIDILIIATPTVTHFNILNEFSKNTNIKMFIMEKPLFSTDNEYDNIPNNIQDKLLINYLRRFDKAIQNLKKNLQLFQTEKILIHYCKGLKNNGSHMIDLVNYLYNNPKIISSTILGSSPGFDQSDFNYDLFIEIEIDSRIIPLYFISHQHTNYNLIELNIYTKESMIKYTNSKGTIEYYNIVADKNFPQYSIFSDQAQFIDRMDSAFPMSHLYDKAYSILEYDDSNISSYYDEIANKIFFNSIFTKKQVVSQL